MPKKYSLGEVKSYFSSKGCVLVSQNYLNSTERLNYTCSCGRDGYDSFKRFKEGKRCPNCSKAQISLKARSNAYIQNKRRSLEEVRRTFSDGGCVLLSTDYTNQKTRLEYLCSCGNVASTYIDAFIKGHRCRKCGILKQKVQVCGDRHYAWNSALTQEDRNKRRDYPEYDLWRREVFQRDVYSCRFCEAVGGILNAHHLYSYATHKDLRVDISNGATLCGGCHVTFHRVFSKVANTPRQFGLFLWYKELPSANGKGFDFHPDNTITRAETAVLLIKTMESLQESINVVDKKITDLTATLKSKNLI